MLVSPMAAVLPWQTGAEMASPNRSYTPQEAPDSHRRGIVTEVSNLALAMVLVLSITLQLRSAKQLRRAMRELG